MAPNKHTVCRVVGGPEPSNVRVYTPAGEELYGVLSVELPKVVSNSMVKAKLEMLVSIDVLAHPVYDLEFIRAAAKAHGFRLVQVLGNGSA